MEVIPNIWNHTSQNDREYLYGLKTMAEGLSYTLVITDLFNNFWIETVNKAGYIKKLDENGIDIIQDSKRAEFLQLLQKMVEDDKSSCRIQFSFKGDVKVEAGLHLDDIPSLLTMKFSNKRLSWNFVPSLQKDFGDVDKLLKYQLFNAISLHRNVIAELSKQIKLKDLILQTLLENFLELNESYNSSLEEEGQDVDFKRKVESNKQLSRIIPNTSHLRSSLFKFNFDEISQNLKTLDLKPFVWSSIQNAILDKKIWELSNQYGLVKPTGNDSDRNKKRRAQEANKVISSEFVNFEDLNPSPSNNDTHSSNMSTSKFQDEEQTVAPKAKVETPSPVKKKTFGVIGGDNKLLASSKKAFGVIGGDNKPLKTSKKTFGVIGGDNKLLTSSKKRKLKAGSTNSPSRSPKLI